MDGIYNRKTKESRSCWKRNSARSFCRVSGLSSEMWMDAFGCKVNVGWYHEVKVNWEDGGHGMWGHISNFSCGKLAVILKCSPRTLKRSFAFRSLSSIPDSVSQTQTPKSLWDCCSTWVQKGKEITSLRSERKQSTFLEHVAVPLLCRTLHEIDFAVAFCVRYF